MEDFTPKLLNFTKLNFHPDIPREILYFLNGEKATSQNEPGGSAQQRQKNLVSIANWRVVATIWKLSGQFGKFPDN